MKQGELKLQQIRDACQSSIREDIHNKKVMQLNLRENKIKRINVYQFSRSVQS